MIKDGRKYSQGTHEEFITSKMLEEVYARQIIAEYIYFYNNQRLQLKTKLTPLEQRNQFVA